MIELHTYDKGESIWVNPDKIDVITKDRGIVFSGSDEVLKVAESTEFVVEKIMRYKLAMNEHKAFTQENKEMIFIQDVLQLAGFKRSDPVEF